MVETRNQSLVKTSQRRFNIYIFLTLLLGLIFTTFTIISVAYNFQNIHAQKANSLATLVEAKDAITFVGDESDEENPVYLAKKGEFQKIKEADNTMRFLYLMGKKDGEIIFLVDSEIEDSEDYSPPGQVYDEASDLLKEVFATGKSGTEIESDRWGYWVTSFAPITDPETGEVVAVLGIDSDAYSQYFFQIAFYSLIPIIAFSFILFIIFSNKRLTYVQSKAIEEKNSILGILMHEVKTPITVIRWNTESVIENNYKVDDTFPTMVGDVYRSSVQIIERINNLVVANELTDQYKEKKEKHLLNDIVYEANKRHKIISNLYGLSISFTLDSEKVELECDKELMTTAMSNILLNLILYSDKNSSIIIGINCVDNKIQLSFEGKGTPIPKEELDSVFADYHHHNSFSQHTEATGLGLFLAKKIIERHNGTIEVKSEGTTTQFCITF